MAPGTEKAAAAKQENKDQETKDADEVLMKGEERRAAGRTHGDVWEEHRHPAGGAKEDRPDAKKHVVSAEKEAAQEVGSKDAYDVLMKESEEQGKRDREQGGENDDPMEAKRPRVAEEQDGKQEKKEAETAQDGAQKEQAEGQEMEVETKPADKEVKEEDKGKGADQSKAKEEADAEKDKPAEGAEKKQEPKKEEEEEKGSGDDEEPKDDVEEGEGGKESGEEKGVEGQVKINRAPVLNLWVAVVAQRQGYTFEEGLTFGKVITGLYANSKGKRLGLVEEADEKTKEENKKARSGQEKFSVFGTRLAGKRTDSGIQAMQGRKPVYPKQVKAYLHRAFKNQLEPAKAAMEALAAAYDPEELSKRAYSLYEKFRPEVPPGAKGWGNKGILDLELVSRTLPSEHERAGA